MPSSFLYMPVKVPVRHDLFEPLAHWLDDESQQVGFHNDNDNDNPLPWVVPKPSFSSVECRSDLKRLAAVRNCLSEVLQDSFQSIIEQRGLQDCQEYHAILLEFEKRGFPTISEESNGIACTWKGAFAKTQHETHYSFVWDRACTLWNIAALQGYMACQVDNFSTREGCKLAIGQFQSAASQLALLQQLVSGSSSPQDDYSTVDFSTPMLQFWEKLFLAQAQVCVYKMANLGETGVRQHTTLGYLIQGAAGLWNEALVLAQDPRLPSEVPKQAQQWGTQCKAQSLICQARALFHMSIDHRQRKGHGSEIAWLQASVEKLKECQSFVQKCQNSDVLQSQVNGLMQLAQDRLSKAKHDNQTIYMEEIPKQLPEIRPQIMVKTNTTTLDSSMMIPQVPLFQFLQR